MRKILTSLLVAALLTLATPALSQINLGIKGGIDNSSMKFDKSVFDTSNRYGWFIGPTLKVGIGPVDVDLSALYDQKEVKINGKGVKMKSVVVPVNARLKAGLGSTAGVYVAAGPQFGFNVGDDSFSWTSKESYENTFQLKESTLSFNLGAGIYLSEKLELGFAYNIGLGKTADASVKGVYDAVTAKDTYEDDSNAKGWTLSATYYF